MFQLDTSVFGNINSKADYDRQKEELKRQKQMQNLQMMALQKQVSATDTSPEQLLAKAIQLGGVQNLSPAEQAQLQAADIAQRTKQSVIPLTGEVISNRSYFDLLGMPAGQVAQMSPSQVMGQRMDSGMISPTMQTVPNTGDFIDVASQPDLPMNGLPMDMVDPIQIPNTQGLSPRTRQVAEEKTIEEQIKLQADQAKKAQESAKAKEGVTQTIGGMAEQYRKLQSLNGITSTNRSLGENVFISATQTNPLAQKAQKVAGSETQTARQVIEASRARLMQDIKKATGMSAQEVNSIPEMQLLKESISDPTMTVEAVEQILGNLERRFGLGQGVSIRDTAPVRKIYNPATGMLE